LKLLERAAERELASHALLNAQVTSAAAAAPWSREGGHALKRIQEHLLKNLTED
jgi:hypothetical protein